MYNDLQPCKTAYIKMDFYKAIFKRKSFHLFRGKQTTTNEDLEKVKHFIKTVRPLCPDIKTEIIVVPENETTCARGADFCVLFYSEKKGDYLHNVGYIGEQIDLFLASENIGALWFGIGKPLKKHFEDLEYVIMIAFAKMPEDAFRKDMFKSKRKPLEEGWEGKIYPFTEVVRFTPSACNTQPWFTIAEDNKLTVYRRRKPGKQGIMPDKYVPYYNRIDMGIYLFMLETCFLRDGYIFDRQLVYDDGEVARLNSLNAVYELTVPADNGE